MKIYILIVFLALYSIMGIAQTETKIDAMGLLYKNYSLGGEFIINKNVSVTLYAKYILDNRLMMSFRNLENTERDFSALKFIPEFRYYCKPKQGADGIFMGIYAIYKTENFNDLSYIDPVSTWDYDYSMSYEGQGLGIIAGYKLLTKSRISIEALLGIGMVTPFHIVTRGNHPSFVNENYYIMNNYITTWDYRFEINIAYRIGKMNKE